MSIETTPGEEQEPAAEALVPGGTMPAVTATEPDSLAAFGIPASIRDSLPATVKGEIAGLTPVQRDAFIEEFRRKAKSSGVAYLCWLFGLHYAYLGDWVKLVIFWITGGGLLIWWIIDLFRVGGLVKEHNKDIAAAVMRDIKIMSR